MKKENGLRRVTAAALALFMVAAICVTGALAAAPTQPSFSVRYELDMGGEGALLFSQEPLETRTGEQYWGGTAYVFPMGTQVAQRLDGELAIIGVAGEPSPGGWSAPSYADDAYEITLTQEMSWDRIGVRILGSNMGRGLATVVVSNEGATQPSFEVKFSIGNLGNEYGSLLFSQEPVDTVGAQPYNYYSGAYVFPLGTKVAYALDGKFVPLSAAEASPWLNGTDWSLSPIGSAQVAELELTEEMGQDEKGVLIVAPRTSSDGTFDTPYLRVVVSDTPAAAVSPEVQMVYQWNVDFMNAHAPQDAAALDRYRQPSDLIPSGHGDIIALAGAITAGQSGDAAKTEAIYTWVADNLWYDYDVFEGRAPKVAKSVLDTLADKRGICGDFVNLTVTLLRASGIPARRVTGLVRSDAEPLSDRLFYGTYQEPEDMMDAIFSASEEELDYYHAWCEAYVDGSWIMMDPTWDGHNSYENGVYEPQAGGIWTSYFDIPVETFSRDHRYGQYTSETVLELETDKVTLESESLLDTADQWAKEGIRSAVDKGFVPADLQSGYTAVITRQEFCRMAVKFVEYHTGKDIDTVLAERGLARDTDAFTDTSDGDILAAYALGITSGTGQHTFSPDGQFSREQAAAMLMNTCRAVGMETEQNQAAGFADMGSVSPWAVGGVNFCWESGIMKGSGENQFSPNGTYTRQESIVTFDRIS